MASLQYLRSWEGQKYKPCDLLFGIDKIWIWISDGVTALKKNESSGELDFLRYSVKGRSAGGNLLAEMLPTFEKCLFKILGICEESLARLLLLLSFTASEQIIPLNTFLILSSYKGHKHYAIKLFFSICDGLFGRHINVARSKLGKLERTIFSKRKTLAPWKLAQKFIFKRSFASWR